MPWGEGGEGGRGEGAGTSITYRFSGFYLLTKG